VGEYDSFITYRNVMSTLQFIRGNGIDRYAELQRERIEVLECLLREYNDGRSKSFFCLASNLLSMASLETVISSTRREIELDGIDDRKMRAKILREYLLEAANKEGIELRLWKAPKQQ
jgi:hypothetical protein